MVRVVASLANVLNLFQSSRMSQSPPNRAKARGVHSNTSGRFEAYATERCDDGWGGDAANDPSIVTQVRREEARRIISYNRSPDLPFDRSINPYRGCEHGCVYCFARPTHAYLGLSPGLDFETQLITRPNASECLTAELAAPAYRPASIALGTNTDPYQPIERDWKITRRCLEVLHAAQHPVAIVTKGAMITRDLDLLSDMAQHGLVRVGISVTTLDADLSRKMEPRAPSPARRLATIEALAAAGVEVRVMASPLVPALTDPELEAILAAGRDAGARYGSAIPLRLPGEVADLWQDWLEAQMPDRAGRILARLREMHGGRVYDPTWGHRMRGSGPYADLLAARLRLALKRTGLRSNAPPLRTDLFVPPAKPPRGPSKQSAKTAAPHAPDQLSLFAPDTL